MICHNSWKYCYVRTKFFTLEGRGGGVPCWKKGPERSPPEGRPGIGHQTLYVHPEPARERGGSEGVNLVGKLDTETRKQWDNRWIQKYLVVQSSLGDWVSSSLPPPPYAKLFCSPMLFVFPSLFSQKKRDKLPLIKIQCRLWLAHSEALEEWLPFWHRSTLCRI